MGLSNVDKNFAVKTEISEENLKFYDAEEAPFRIYGVFREGDRFRRIPEALAKTVNDGVKLLHSHTAGGRVRFLTDSRYVAINVAIDNSAEGPQFSLTGRAGLDMYERIEGTQRYIGTFMPPVGLTDGFESINHFNERRMREITINLPLYADVKKLYIGLEGDAEVKAAPDYRLEKPVVYYGSSITQGGCASKPGSTYQNILTQRLDFNYINLGFSGSALGEDVMAEYIAALDMSMFVMDYDHNAPTAAHLEKTHERFFKLIRSKHPELPIIIMGAPGYTPFGDDEERNAVLIKTYNNAKAAGDENVYLIMGRELMSLVEYNGTVDNCHPTDSGFLSMANTLEPIMKKILF